MVAAVLAMLGLGGCMRAGYVEPNPGVGDAGGDTALVDLRMSDSPRGDQGPPIPDTALPDAPAPDAPGVSNQGLIGYWPFDEGAGTLAADVSGNQLDLALGAAAGWCAQGKHGAALDISTSGATATVTSAKLALAADLTISVWYKLVASQKAAGEIVTYGPSLTETYELTLLDTGAVRYHHDGATKDAMFDVPHAPALQPGGWHHLAVVRAASSKTVRLYFDGAEIAALTYSDDPLVDPAATFNVGTAAYHFNGLVDELRIYARPLTASEIGLLAQ